MIMIALLAARSARGKVEGREVRTPLLIVEYCIYRLFALPLRGDTECREFISRGSIISPIMGRGACLCELSPVTFLAPGSTDFVISTLFNVQQSSSSLLQHC